MRKTIRKWFVAGAVALAAAGAARGVEVRDVRVEAIGAVPVAAAQVMSRVQVRPGMELDRAALSEDVRRLQECGAFSYVESRLENSPGGGVELVFHVAGRPRIRRLEVVGAEYLGNKKVKKLMEIASGDRVDGALLGAKSQAVKDEYRKHFFPDTRVSWDLRPREDEPSEVDVTIRVEEGERKLVRKIVFRGKKHLKDRELRAVMVQKQSSWLTWFNNDGEYLAGALLADTEAIKKAFWDKGYLAAKVAEPVFRRVNKKKIDVIFEVEEGPLYTLEDWRTTGVTLFPEAEVTRGVVAKKGQVASLDAIERSAKAIGDYYGARGYIRTSADPRVNLDAERATARVTYAVKEGELAWIQDVEIRGNSLTKDKVIRREISVAPGDVYNTPRVRSSENRVRNLNYFSYVRAYPESTAVSNRYRLVFDVEEKPTASMMFSIGFSSVDNIVGAIEFNQGNFDLFDAGSWFRGGGQKLKIRLQAGRKRQDAELAFIEPWFLNRKLSLGFNAFWREASYYSNEYDQQTVGSSVTLGKSLDAFDRVNLTYGLQNIKIDDVSTNAAAWILEEEGTRLKSYSTLELVRDTRDSSLVATRGFRGSVSATLAGGPLGADTDNYGFGARASQFVPLWFGHVLNVRGGANMVKEYGDSDRVPIFDREFLGGPRSVRAFKYRKLGPKDEEGEPRGGRSSAWATAEYSVPIAKSVRLAGFYDGGIVWQGLFKEEVNEEVPVVGDGEWCDGYGVGIRLDFPGFPIQLDYAWPIHTDDMLPDHGRFSFNIGYMY
jgi:outer membrane protein insertion porin family